MGKGWSRLLVAGMIALGVHGFVFFLHMPDGQQAMSVPLPLECIVVSLGAQDDDRHTPEKHAEKSEQRLETAQSPLLAPVATSVVESYELQQPISAAIEEGEIQLTSESQTSLQERAPLQPEVSRVSTTAHTSLLIQKATPLYQVNPPPNYPRLARRRGFEGTVLLDVLVDLWGGVKERKIIHSSGHSILDKAALKAVGRWQFRAGSIDGQSQEMWVQVPVRFRLH